MQGIVDLIKMSLRFRHLASQYILPVMVSTLFFVGFMLTFQLIKIINLVMNKGVEIGVIVDMLHYMALSFLPLSLPLAVLFSTVYVVGKLSEDLEIVIFRYSGASIFQLLRPFLFIAFVLAGFIYVAGDRMIPHSKKEFRKILSVMTSEGFLAEIRPGNFFTQIPGIVLFAEKVEDGGQKLSNIFIAFDQPDLRKQQVIMAQEGFLAKKDPLLDQSNELRLKLYNGNIMTRYLLDLGRADKVLFKEYDFPIPIAEISNQFVTKDSMQTNSELWSTIQDKSSAKERNTTRTEIEFYSRFNTPLLILIFCFVGFYMGIQNSRGKKRNSSSLALAIIVGYYSLYFFGISLAKSEVLHPMLAITTPSLVIFLVGFYYYRKLNWIS